jgi:hypothetical protein
VRFAPPFFVLLAVAAIAAACASSASKVGAGAECFLASDCEDGLVCVPQANGGRVCSSDISRVAGSPPAEGGAGDANAADATDAPADGPPADAPVQDTGADTGPADAGQDG